MALHTLQTRPRHTSPATPSRREFLRIGSLVGLGLSAQGLRSVAAGMESTTGRRATRCILVWLDGGPSHIDTFDPKPDASSEVRGPLAPLATKIPGIYLSELFPQLAQRMDRLALVRSVTSPLGEHNLGAQYMMTGYRPSPVIEYPTFPAVLAGERSSALHRGGTFHASPQGGVESISALPTSVAIPNFSLGGGRIDATGFLPPHLAPFSLNSDPAGSDYSLRALEFSPRGMPREQTAHRLRRRQRYRQWLAGDGGVDPLTDQAFEMLGDPKVRQAFDLDQESPATRQRYGMRSVGQSCLLARRLIESGVSLVSVIDNGWDTHQSLVTRLKDGFTGARVPSGLGPSLDRALAALTDDLVANGLYEETLLVVMGEFGRTPKLNAGGGRDHWPRVFSVLMGGGPILGGTVVGSSDRNGESPASNPVTPADVAHTIYTAMGVDPSRIQTTPDGRPISVADPASKPISAMLA